MIRRLGNNIFFWIILGLLVRLCLIYSQYSGDIGNHIAWGRGFLESGPGFYSRNFQGFNQANYPPLAIYLFAGAYSLYLNFINTLVWLNQHIPAFPSFIIPHLFTLNARAAFLKIPSILADLGIAYLIYKLSYKKILALLFLFNPAVIYVSTIWGQIEPITVFFLLLSLYFASPKSSNPKSYILSPISYILSPISYTLSVLTKQTALWLLPVYIVLWWKQGIKPLFIGLLLQVVVFILSFQPLLSQFSVIKPFSIYLSTLSGSSPYISDAAWNLWSFLYPGKEISDFVLLGFLSVRVWSIAALVVIYLAVFVFVIKKYSTNTTFVGLFLLSLAAFFIQTRVHERHLYPALVFLLLIPLKPIIKYPLFTVLSLFFMANLYSSLHLPFI